MIDDIALDAHVPTQEAPNLCCCAKAGTLAIATTSNTQYHASTSMLEAIVFMIELCFDKPDAGTGTLQLDVSIASLHMQN